MGRAGEQGWLRDAVRSANRFWWVSTPPRGSIRDRPQERSILGKEGGMVIRVGARQSKAKTTPKCLTSAESIRGLCGEKKRMQ